MPSRCVYSYIEQSSMITSDFPQGRHRQILLTCVFLSCSIEIGAGGGLVG